MGNNSSSGGGGGGDRSGGAQADRYRDGQQGGKEPRSKILLDTTEDGDSDPKVGKIRSKITFFWGG